MIITREEVLNDLLTNLEAAKLKYIEYWYAWDTFGGDHYEGVIWEIDNGTYHILCTDGKERAV